MTFFYEIWHNFIKRLPQFFSIATKLGLVVGATCLACYSLKIGHFPRELSVGDSFLLLITAAAAGIVGLIFIGSLLCLGIALSFIPKAFFKFAMQINNKYSRKKIQLQHTLVSFDWLAALASSYAIIIMIALGKENAFVYISFPLLAIMMYIFLSIFTSCEAKIIALNNGEDVKALLSDEDGKPRRANSKDLRNAQRAASIMILVMPFLLSGVTPQLLDLTMRMLQIRTEHATIFLLEPYATLLANSEATELPMDSTAWRRFDNVTVLSAGYGKYTVVSNGIGKKAVNPEIPNDKIIVR